MMINSTFTALAFTAALPIIACAQRSVPLSATPNSRVALTEFADNYEISGSSVDALRLAIARRGLVSEAGRRYDARTEWAVRWRYAGTRSRGTGCEPNGVTVLLELTVTLPVWKDSEQADAPAAVREEWTRYITALKAHEGRHASLAVAGANRLADKLRDVSEPYCSRISPEFARLTNDEVRRVRAENEAYDVETRHGVAEGASLGAALAPPSFPPST